MSEEKPRSQPAGVFLDWQEPFLPQAVDWLWQVYGRPRRGDLGGVVAVVPGRRAGRRLLLRLAQQARKDLAAGSRGLVPPAVLTVGSLPEILYRPRLPTASPLETLLAWVAVLRRAPDELRSRLLPHPPAQGDFTGWLELAQLMETLREELAREGLAFHDVAVLCEARSELPEEPRWQALAELYRDVGRHLEAQGLQDLQAARLEALARAGRDSSHGDKDIVLVGLVDLGRLFCRLLEPLAPRVTALVPAPQSERHDFDPWGCLRVDRWIQRKIPLRPQQVRVVDRPLHLAWEVVDAIGPTTTAGEGSERSLKSGRLHPRRVTVAVGDPRTEPGIRDALDWAGVPSHSPVGRPLALTRPARLLDAYGRYLASRRFSDFAVLLRHPDVEDYLRRHIGPKEDLPPSTGSGSAPGHTEAAAAADRGQWLTVVDLYTTDTLQGEVGREWPGDPVAATALKELDETLRRLLPHTDEPRPLPSWSPAVLGLLREVYGGRRLNRGAPEDGELYQALALLAECLQQQYEVSAQAPSTPKLGAAQAIELTLGRLSQQTLPDPNSGLEPGDPSAPSWVELLGWLEMLHDDGPVVVVAGMNEGQIPQSVRADPFLPNHLRATLGLVDNDRRFARDSLILTALLHSRQDVTLIAARRSLENEPLPPSRLLLACPEEELPAMVLRFYEPTATVPPREGETAPRHPAGAPPRSKSRLPLPSPMGLKEPLRQLPVTAFRDYLECPYRFYLKRVLGLRAMSHLPRELGGGAFGSLAHEVLRRFGCGELATCSDEGALRDHLSSLLDRVSKERFGNSPVAAARVQIEQLRRRLQAFAGWQAQESRQGWRIQTRYLEERLSAPLEVDGEVCTLTGRIDRIDRHSERGYRILDYKTTDRGLSPHQVHRKRTTSPPYVEAWADLQLPLYGLLAEGAGIQGQVELGYVRLPKDLDEVGWATADWSPALLADAVEEARDVIRKIRKGVFWPPGETPPFDDGFSWISPASAAAQGLS